MTKLNGKAAAAAAPETQPRPRGRPPVPAHELKSCTVRARVTDELAEVFDGLGGADWLRTYLARAAARQKKAAQA